MLISGIQSNNIGAFRVVVTSGFGSVTSVVANLDVVPGFNASLIAYEGFSYPSNTDLSLQNGGYGWGSSWSDVIGDTVVAGGTNGSLGYRDALGNSLLTSGNTFDYSAAAVPSGDSRTFRDLSVTRGADYTTTWLSFLAVRVGPPTNLTSNPYPSAANISLYNGNTEILAIGTSSGAASNTWMLLPAGHGTNAVPSSYAMSNLSLVVVRIDHKPGNDDAYLFINPTLGREPQPSEAAAQSIGAFDYTFNRIRPFVRADAPAAEMKIDEIRVGNTYGSVTPFTPSTASNLVAAYTQNFEGTVGPEWSNTATSLTPTNSRRFLGQFTNQTVRLTLTNLPPHTFARVTFDVFVILSWDGNAPPTDGPDIFSVAANGTQLLRTTFNNVYASLGTINPNVARSVAYGQTFPGNYSTSNNSPVFPPQSGAAEANTLGYIYAPSTWPSPVVMDAVYHITRVVGDTNGTLAVDFTGSGLEPLINESWGLDNVQVDLFDTSADTVLLNAQLPPQPLLPGNPVAQPVTVIGTFLPDNLTLDITRAAGISYISSDPNIFTVNATGEISAVAPGTTNLNILYGGSGFTLAVNVPAAVGLRQTVPPSLNAGGVPVVIPLTADFTAMSNVVVTGFGGVTRTSSDPTVATIAADGTVVPSKAGVTTLTAVYAGMTNQASLTVVLPVGFKAGALVHRYSFSEPPNTNIVTDSVGGANGQLLHISTGGTANNYNGTGQLNLSGGAGGSGTASYVNLPNGLVSGLQSVTIEGWVTWNGPTNSPWQRIFDFGRNLATNSVGDYLEDQFNATGASYFFFTPFANSAGTAGQGTSNRMRFATRQSIGIETALLEGAGAMTVSNQTHFAVVYDAPSGVARLYLNGQRVATAPAIQPLKGIEDLNVWLGRSQFSTDAFFNGLYNEFRIYDGALLDGDVQSSFTNGPDVFAGRRSRRQRTTTLSMLFH